MTKYQDYLSHIERSGLIYAIKGCRKVITNNPFIKVKSIEFKGKRDSWREFNIVFKNGKYVKSSNPCSFNKIEENKILTPNQLGISYFSYVIGDISYFKDRIDSSLLKKKYIYTLYKIDRLLTKRENLERNKLYKNNKEKILKLDKKIDRLQDYIESLNNKMEVK